MDENNPKVKRTECKCKYLQLDLSTTTAAEYGDLAALSHRLSTSHSSNIKKNSEKRIQIIPGNTPLHLSSQHGHTAMTSYLLEMGYNSNSGLLSSSALPQSYNEKPNSLDRTDYSTQMDERKSNHNSPAYKTPTPLHRACFSGALGCIQLLLNARADILIPDLSFGDGMNAMHKAVKGGRPLAVILLLKHLKQLHLLSLRKEVFNSRDSKNRTPLQIAMEYAKRGAEEISSLRRWDVVAGGSSANFEECVRLLRIEEEDIACMVTSSSSSSSNECDNQETREEFELEKGSTGSGLNELDSITRRRLESSSKNITRKDKVLVCPPITSKHSSALLSFQNISSKFGSFAWQCDCSDESEGNGARSEIQRCKTAVWEAQFQNALLKSTMDALAPTTQDSKKHNSHRNSHKTNKSNVDNLLPAHQNQTFDGQIPVEGGTDSEFDVSKVICPPQEENDKRRSPVDIKHVDLNLSLANSRNYQHGNINCDRRVHSTTKETDNDMNKLGQPCSKCAKRSLTLFRDNLGNFVCRTCSKQIRRKRY